MPVAISSSREEKSSRPVQKMPTGSRIGYAVALVSAALAGPVMGAEPVTPGYKNYMTECSKCHGVGQASPAKVSVGRPAGFITVAAVTEPPDSRPQYAFALPYGPNLRGVIGRSAGSIANYDYSKAFLAALRGTVWDATSLDIYLTNSQQRAPGSRMYYRQADPAVRKSIIEFLSGFQ